ncbi:MAG: hypothetical protein Q9163_003366 [Psora crenata]
MKHLVSGLKQNIGRLVCTEEGGRRQGDVPPITIAIQEKIRAEMYRRGSATERFICEARLRENIWSKFSLNEIPTFEHWDPKGLDIVKEDYTLAGNLTASEWLSLKMGLNDDSLPFEESKLLGLGGLRQQFIELQFIFKPQTIKWWYRLPFTKEPELLGKGSSGEVTKRTIAPGYFVEIREHKKAFPNPEETVVACKEFVLETLSKSFRDDLAGLNFLRESLSEKAAILNYFIAVAHGPKLYIFFPFVQHFNL